MADDILIRLTRDQAVVLLEWLARTSEARQPAAFEDQAEQRALWDLEASLESVLPELFREDYRYLVDVARARLRDDEEG